MVTAWASTLQALPEVGRCDSQPGVALANLAEAVRDAGQGHAEALRAVELPVAGSA
jgi:hypothetical protein